MAVFRVEKSRGYTVMSNHHLRNKELSLKAKGLLSQMLSLPEDWDYTLAGLSHINRESIDAIRTAVWELEKAGYITRRQGRDEKGKMAAIEYTIYEQPQPPSLENPILENPTTDKPVLENPTTENPTSDNPTQINKEEQRTDLPKKEKSNTDLSNTHSIPMLIVQDQVWNRVTVNRAEKKATRYYMDEFHLLLKEEQTAAYSVEIWKRFRKWGGIPTAITQNVKDLLASREVENIFENSDFVLMLNQAQGDRAILAKQLNISPQQMKYVTHTEAGEGLIFYGNVVLPFIDRFPKDTELYRVMTTKPEEVGDA